METLENPRSLVSHLQTKDPSRIFDWQKKWCKTFKDQYSYTAVYYFEKLQTDQQAVEGYRTYGAQRG